MVASLVFKRQIFREDTANDDNEICGGLFTIHENLVIIFIVARLMASPILVPIEIVLFAI